MWTAIMGDVSGSRYDYFYKGERSEEPLLQARATDDTILTVAVEEILLLGLDPVETFHRYFWEYPDAGYGHDFGMWCLSKETKPYGSWGNGALMRISPCAYYSSDLKECLKKAAEITAVTHNSEQALNAVEVFITMLFKLYHGEIQKDQLAEFMNKSGYELPETMDGVDMHDNYDMSCDTTLIHAVGCCIETSNFQEAVELSNKIGGDADTRGCVLGAICEAIYGPELNIYMYGYLDRKLVEIVDEFYSYFITNKVWQDKIKSHKLVYEVYLDKSQEKWNNSAHR